MSVNTYRLKFYAFSGADPSEFCKDLAVVLDIDVPQAWVLLGRAPVVIREGVTKEKAEKLMALLTGIQALCLVEPEQAGAEEVAPTAEQPVQQPSEYLQTVALEKKRGEEETDLWISRFWISVIATVAGVALLCGVVAFVSTALKIQRESRAKVEPDPQTAVTTQTPVEAVQPAFPPAYEVEARIEALEAKIEELNRKLDEAQEELNRALTTGTAGPQLRAELGQRIGDLRDEIVLADRELKELRQLLADIQAQNAQP